jgi:hypothetical protein
MMTSDKALNRLISNKRMQAFRSERKKRKKNEKMLFVFLSVRGRGDADDHPKPTHH